MNHLFSGLIAIVEAQSAVTGTPTGGTLTNTGTNIALSVIVAVAILTTLAIVMFSRRRSKSAKN